MQKEGSEVNTPEKSLETISRQEVEDFLYKEGYLLDEWQLDEWLSLFTPDAQYVVPTNDLPEADPENDLVYIDHDSDQYRPDRSLDRLRADHSWALRTARPV